MVRALSLAAVALLLGAAGTSGSRSPQPSAHRAACPAVDSSRFALDPHCAALHPTPDLPTAGGILELRPTPSPFGVTVTADGRPRHRLLATIRGLPLPSAVDPRARHYVAWATNLAMDTTVRLGDVSNGENDLGEVNLEQFRGLMASDEPSGRKMDFLIQEMHREVNTTGSKSQHPEISSRVVSMKAEIERIREQVQNVE